MIPFTESSEPCQTEQCFRDIHMFSIDKCKTPGSDVWGSKRNVDLRGAGSDTELHRSS